MTTTPPRTRRPRTPRQRAARRRQVVALVGVLMLAGIAAVALPRVDDAPARPRDRDRAVDIEPTTAASSDPADPPGGDDRTDEPDPPPVATEPYVAPPAWLTWVSGGFAPSFRAASREMQGLRETVVVAGETLWLTASRDADGRVVDRPTPPYRIPIDAFAVDPGAYAPFVSDPVSTELVDALRRGEAVLGESSAALRRLGVGGALEFGAQRLVVGAVVPDDAVGWSEMLVSRTVGRGLGINHDRYMLALTGNDALTEAAFSKRIGSMVPAGTPIRVDAPGSTPYVRVASGVRPVIVMKQVFGEFSAIVEPGGVYLDLDPRWVEENIVTKTVPLLGRVTCHRKLFPPLVAALEDLQAQGLGSLVEVYSGCWVARTIARSPTAPPSYHSYGAAIDINAPTNPYGQPPTMDLRMVDAFERQGFNWGGDFLTPDGHHFEYWGQPGDRPPG